MQVKDGRRFGSNPRRFVWLSAVSIALALLSIVTPSVWRALANGNFPGYLVFSDPSGSLATVTTNGSFDSDNPFFQSLGTNGRSCATCHVASDGWSITPPHIQSRFAETNGSDPLFRPVDGSDCPDSPGAVSTPPLASAFSLLLSKGLIRVALPLPPNAQFTVSVIYDPYGCALTKLNGQETVSVYRRPLPATNLRFLSAVMFDGRETVQPLNSESTFAQNLRVDLAHQALDATLGHAQASNPPSSSVLQQIVDFELSTFTAQHDDNLAGNLIAQGGRGGPRVLSKVPYYPGINDSLGGNPTGAAFDANAFTIFSAWANVNSSDADRFTQARSAVARGEAIFNAAPVAIQGVKGLNDVTGIPVIMGTCTTCHDTPNVGNHSFPVPLDIGISDVAGIANPSSPQALDELNPPVLPVYALQCSTTMGAATDETIYTSDPGRALITGRCADIGKFKGPILRGLAARAPYFQNGSADTLEQVVRFYNARFQMGLTADQIADLVAFLKSL